MERRLQLLHQLVPGERRDFIVPGYAYPRDAAAIETYRRLYPEREIVQVRVNDIAIGGGRIHCITQQQPEARF